MITKKQSKMLQGIAILLMIYHHFFLAPDTQLYRFINVELTRKADWFAKICVGLFSFISGYGMCVALSKVRAGGQPVLCRQYQSVGRRLVRLFLKYWFIVALDVLLCVCLFQEPLTWKECLENAFLIHLSLSGSWWFMREYLIFLLLAPILDMLLDGIWENHGKRRWVYSTVVLLCMGIFAVLKLFVPAMDSFFDLIQPAFIAAFIVGFLLKKCGAYEFVERKLPKNRMLQTALGIVLTVVVIASRVTLATDVSWAKFDFILAPIFALGIILMFRYTKGIAGLLETLGKHSVYMWLIHTMVYDRTGSLVRRLTSQSFCVYMIEVAVTFAVSWVLQAVVEKIGKRLLVDREKNGRLQKILKK